MKAIAIRRARIGDATQLQALNREFNRDRTPLGWMKQQLANVDAVETVFVALNERKIVGFCCVTIVPSFCRENPRAEITELFVLKPSRRTGVAKALMAAAERHADGAGVAEFFVLTNKLNHQGRSFYKSLGYLEGNDLLFRRGSREGETAG